MALCSAFPREGGAQQLEKPSLRLGVANKSHLYYLPVTLAERRGYFRDYGLNVSIVDFEGGSQSLEALLGGSVDLVTGAYEHVLHTQAKGQDIRALIELGRFPGIVLAVRKDQPYKSPADLKGMKIGVTAPGSSSHFFVLYLMAKAGLQPTDATLVGVGGGAAAVEAMKNGSIDATANFDPVITRLEAGRNYPDRDRYPLSAGELRNLRWDQSGRGAVRQAGFHRREPEHCAGAGDGVLQDAEVDRHGDDR